MSYSVHTRRDAREVGLVQSVHPPSVVNKFDGVHPQ